MTAYAKVGRADGILHEVRGLPDAAGFGPPTPPPIEDGFDFHQVERTDYWKVPPPTPTSALQWNGGDPEWVETATLDDLRSKRNADINGWKLEANNTYFEFGGKQISYTAADRVEIQAINNVVLLTGAMPVHPDWPKAWKAIDNAWVALPDLAAWTAFNLAIAERGTAHFKRAQELKGALARAATPAEIEAITW